MTREEVSEISKALSDINRLKIIEMLVEGEKCGCRLLEELKVTPNVHVPWPRQPNIIGNLIDFSF